MPTIDPNPCTVFVFQTLDDISSHIWYPQFRAKIDQNKDKLIAANTIVLSASWHYRIPDPLHNDSLGFMRVLRFIVRDLTLATLREYSNVCWGDLSTTPCQNGEDPHIEITVATESENGLRIPIRHINKR